jgi:hypothetical protein
VLEGMMEEIKKINFEEEEEDSKSTGVVHIKPRPNGSFKAL